VRTTKNSKVDVYLSYKLDMLGLPREAIKQNNLRFIKKLPLRLIYLK
jgi:hypothetical protein